jgi:hypothetical protein
MNASNKRLCQGMSMGFLLKHEGTHKLSFQFLEMLVSLVANLVPNPYNHQLELVNLTHWLGLDSRLLLCLLLCLEVLPRHLASDSIT